MGRVKLGWSLAILGLLGLVAWSVIASAPEAGRAAQSGPAPDIGIKTSSGVVRLSQQRGRVVLLDFWGTWCGPCRQSIPFVERMYKRYKDRGFVVLGVAIENDDGRGIPGFIYEMGMTYPAGMYTKAEELQAYSQGGLPHMAIVDRQGNLQWQRTGYSEALEPVVEDEIRRHL